MKASNRVVLLAGAALLAVSGSATWAGQGDAAPAARRAGATAPVAATAADDALYAGFRNPPGSARPRTWWHWMNGNISKDGIRADLAWMARVGMGGVQNFDAALQTPQVVGKRLIYMTPAWKDAFAFAVAEADRLGLEYTVAASPGWSETGGPWVPPADGMKKLVWSETAVVGGRPVATPLPLPPRVTGAFQDIPRNANLAANDSGKPDPNFYADVAVLAYPVPDGEAAAPVVTDAAGTRLDAAALVDGRYGGGVAVPRGTAAAPGFVVADFGRPRRVRSASIAIAKAAAVFQPPQVVPLLEAEDGAGRWRRVTEMPLDGGVQTTVAFAPITARRLRITFTPVPPMSPDFLGKVPGAVVRPLFRQENSATLTLAELRFSDEERIDRFEVKAGFGLLPDYTDVKTDASPSARGIDPARVVDLTARMQADGTLDWTPSAGRWRIVRFGYSLVGTTNHPAPAEATGLEVDKYDGPAVGRYMSHYIGLLREAAGPGMVGARGVRAVLTDSIEVGASNWTPALLAQFRRLRGYDARPWLPALTGTVIGSRAASDRFLFDFRATLADLIASEHYGQVAATAHANGLQVYGEALEAGRPTLGDELAMRRHADVPMAALWTYEPAKGPRVGLLGDMKGAASVAHVNGQNVTAAESLTAAFSPWAFAPADLKPVMDLEFAYGINRPVIHTSVHQPVDDRLPGLSLGPFGQYFNRHETWAEMARPWVDYMARSSFLLQQGRYFADVAYFYGEDAPLTVLYDRQPPADLPTRYGFDFVDGDMLSQDLRVEGGDLVARSGARYRVLYLGGSSRSMTLPVLRRIAALVRDGATVVGAAPTASPSLPDDAADHGRLVAQLWAGGAVTRVGSGRVIAGNRVEAALASIGVAPDVQVGADNRNMLFLHRRLADGDLYFLTNRGAQAVTAPVRFRVTGKAPELWHADTGTSEPLSYRTEGSDTVVPLALAGNDSAFVIFRKATSLPAVTVTAPVYRAAGAVSGPWTVTFQPGRGAPASTRMAALAPLNEAQEAGIRYFSGTATYAATLEVSRTLRRGAPLLLDLGKVGDVAEVLVNGRSAGIAWKAPYRVDVGGLVRPGRNRLTVRVANLWVNRLIGDAQPGARKIAWTAEPTYLPDAPLRPSGLIGPVSLVTDDRAANGEPK